MTSAEDDDDYGSDRKGDTPNNTERNSSHLADLEIQKIVQSAASDMLADQSKV